MLILTECNLASIVSEILNGQTVVFPTETSYGLGCDATNQQAVDKLFKIKGRPSDKPLLVVVPSVEMAKQSLVWNDALEKISKQYWPSSAKASTFANASVDKSEGKPGALTVVGSYKLPATSYQLATGVVSQDNTLAIRVTAHPLLKSITEMMGRPLVATSANVADAGEIYNSADIVSQFKNRDIQPDIVLNYGELPKRPPSTIVSVVRNELKIIRQGEIVIEN